jgi:hypothetical protein
VAGSIVRRFFVGMGLVWWWGVGIHSDRSWIEMRKVEVVSRQIVYGLDIINSLITRLESRIIYITPARIYISAATMPRPTQPPAVVPF